MDAREELAERARTNPWDYPSKSSAYAAGFIAGQSSLVPAGYRKMPSREAVADAIACQSGFRWDQVPPLTRNAYLGMADAILALMDGNK